MNPAVSHPQLKCGVGDSLQAVTCMTQRARGLGNRAEETFELDLENRWKNILESRLPYSPAVVKCGLQPK